MHLLPKFHYTSTKGELFPIKLLFFRSEQDLTSIIKTDDQTCMVLIESSPTPSFGRVLSAMTIN